MPITYDIQNDKLFQRGLEKGEAIGIEKGEAIGIEKGEAIGMEKGEAIGMEKGRETGLELATEVIALLRAGRSIEETARRVGLPEAAVAKLADKFR